MIIGIDNSKVDQKTYMLQTSAKEFCILMVNKIKYGVLKKILTDAGFKIMLKTYISVRDNSYLKTKEK